MRIWRDFRCEVVRGWGLWCCLRVLMLIGVALLVLRCDLIVVVVVVAELLCVRSNLLDLLRRRSWLLRRIRGGSDRVRGLRFGVGGRIAHG